jgi:hypothetical protein
VAGESSREEVNKMKNVSKYWKAIIGFVAPGIVILGSALTDASDGGSTITSTEWITALVACVATAGGVYAKANKA